MCLAIPGQVTHVEENDGVLMGTVAFGEVKKQVCLAYVPDIQVGQYVIVHVGFAISQVDEQSAQETLRNFQQLGLLEEELGEAPT